MIINTSSIKCSFCCNTLHATWFGINKNSHITSHLIDVNNYLNDNHYHIDTYILCSQGFFLPHVVNRVFFVIRHILFMVDLILIIIII
ncbi:hypothetical protein PPBDW_I21191 [Photobacterium kishitanii]|nr:hypothetical protein PPBDW_I21191 [Photobacterium kishitanii]